MLYHVTIDGRTYAVGIDGDAVTLDGKPVDAGVAPLPGTDVQALRLGQSHQRLVAVSSSRESWHIQAAGRLRDVEVVDERTRVIQEMTGSSASAAKAASLRAPMPGLVVKVAVEEGETVVRGQGVVIVEAMKMENELAAEVEARVGRVLVEPGQTVEKGQVLVELEPSESGNGV